MLSKDNRLKREEINLLKTKKDCLLQGKFFGLVFQFEKGVKKFALIVSGKIASKAYQRNQIKRLFFRAIENNFFNNAEGKFLFLAKKCSYGATLAELCEEMEFFKKKMNLR